MNRIGLKVSCFVVSVLIWVQVASNSTVEQITQLPLRVVGIGAELTDAGSEIPDRVKVRVQGSKLRLLSHNYFNRYIGEVRVNLSDRVAGPTFSYELSPSDVYTDMVVMGIQPPVRLRLKLDHEARQMLPVVLTTEGALPEGVGLLTAPRVSPDSVMVTGPERFFPPNGQVVTEAVDLSRQANSGEVNVALQSPHEELKMASREARVQFAVASIVERTLANLPVIPLVDAGQPEVGVSPPVVDVMVRGVADSIQALTESRFLVTVSVGARQEGVYALSGQVDPPTWLTVIGLDPPMLQVIVGNPDYSDTTEIDRQEEDAVD